jgi:VWFA-related protein
MQTQFVTVEAVITDSTGNVVRSLEAGDFTVYENGEPQKLSYCEAPSKGEDLPAMPRKDKYGRDDWGNAPLTMLVIDTLNTPFDEIAYSREEVDRSLKAQPSLMKQPTIVLWLDDSGIHALTPFTRSREDLLAAVDSHKPAMPEKLIRGEVVDQLSMSFSAIQQLAVFSRGSKGSKQIVWVGRSFPGINIIDLTSNQTAILNKAITSTLDLLLAARATIYVIDPTVNAVSSDMVTDVSNTFEIQPDTPEDPFKKSFSFMSFVDQAGGKYFNGRTDLNNEIENSIERGTSSYKLGYHPSNPIRDGAYRKIDIRLRNPKLRIQAKQGYYPAPDSDTKNAVTAKELTFDLHEALVTGMVYNGVGMRFERCDADQNHGGATCNVLVDNQSLTLKPGPDDSERGAIVAVISALDSKSVILANKIYHVAIKVPAQSTQNSFTRVPLRLAIPAKAQMLRIAVRDSSGRIGTVDLDQEQVKKLRDIGR